MKQKEEMLVLIRKMRSMNTELKQIKASNTNSEPLNVKLQQHSKFVEIGCQTDQNRPEKRMKIT